MNKNQETTSVLTRILSFNSNTTRPHNCPNCHCKSQCVPPPDHQPHTFTMSANNYKTFSSVNNNYITNV